VDRLKEYKSRLVVFPRRANRVKTGDSDKATIAEAQQLQGAIVAAPAKTDAVTFVAITEVLPYLLTTLPF